MSASLSRDAIGVLLYPPVILLRHLFWTIFIGCMTLAFTAFPSWEPHIRAPYIMAGRTAAEYINLALLIDSLVSIKDTRVWKLG